MTVRQKRFWLTSLLVLLAACSSAKKNASEKPELSELQGKKVAFLSVEGEATARKIVEVALINQLVQRGTFILISKQEVDAAQKAPDQDPMDWRGIATRAGADYALQAQVLQFEAPIQEGYSTREVQDSQLAEEMGTDGKTQQVFKAKSLNGHVRIQLTFTRLIDGETKTAVAEAEEKIEANSQSSSIRLPPQLRFLEDLSNKAFRKFFDQYN
jgi:hypothetical protein